LLSRMRERTSRQASRPRRIANVAATGLRRETSRQRFCSRDMTVRKARNKSYSPRGSRPLLAALNQKLHHNGHQQCASNQV
jgi:hypothetical protein